MNQEAIAATIVAGLNHRDIPVAQQGARQGDLMLARRGDCAPGEHPQGHLVLARGAHGEHHLVGRIRVLAPGQVSIQGAVLAHTDEPRARHGAIGFCPGIWEHWVLREIKVDESIVEVLD